MEDFRIRVCVLLVRLNRRTWDGKSKGLIRLDDLGLVLNGIKPFEIDAFTLEVMADAARKRRYTMENVATLLRERVHFGPRGTERTVEQFMVSDEGRQMSVASSGGRVLRIVPGRFEDTTPEGLNDIFLEINFGTAGSRQLASRIVRALPRKAWFRVVIAEEDQWRHTGQRTLLDMLKRRPAGSMVTA